MPYVKNNEYIIQGLQEGKPSSQRSLWRVTLRLQWWVYHVNAKDKNIFQGGCKAIFMAKHEA